jgi:hypothetical protein
MMNQKLIKEIEQYLIDIGKIESALLPDQLIAYRDTDLFYEILRLKHLEFTLQNEIPFVYPDEALYLLKIIEKTGAGNFINTKQFLTEILSFHYSTSVTKALLDIKLYSGGRFTLPYNHNGEMKALLIQKGFSKKDADTYMSGMLLIKGFSNQTGARLEYFKELSEKILEAVDILQAEGYKYSAKQVYLISRVDRSYYTSRKGLNDCFTAALYLEGFKSKNLRALFRKDEKEKTDRYLKLLKQSPNSIRSEFTNNMLFVKNTTIMLKNILDGVNFDANPEANTLKANLSKL